MKTAQELKAVDQEGIALQVLGRVHAARGEARQAVGALERGAELLRATHERRELARTIAALGKLYRGLPRWDQRHAEADALLSEARAIFTELGAALDLRSLEEPAATH